MLGASLTPVPDFASGLHARLAGFSGFLHANGFGVGADDAARVLATVGKVGVLDSQVLRWSLKALLCGRAVEWRRFDSLFDAYFMPPNKQVFVQGNVRTPRERDSVLGAEEDAHALEENARSASGDARRSLRYSASRQESLAATDFKDLANAQDARDIESLMRRFARRLRRLRLRREAASTRGRRLDFARTIRRSVQHGGMPLRLTWRDHRRIRPRIVLLLDVSRSMSSYSFFYLRLARALSAELADVHSFIFHTRITGVSAALRDADPWRAQEKMHLLAAGWGGGTRIGECLRDFLKAQARRLLHSRTAVLILSDGYDTGEPEVLGRALVDLRRRARRVVWINPLAGRSTWSPSSRAMQAALPHIDLLAPGADLAALTRVLPAILDAMR